MGGSLWGNVGKGAPQASDASQKAELFKRVLKENNLILSDIQREFRKLDAEHNLDRDKVHLHASEICKGDWCPRSSWYRITGTEPDYAEVRGNVVVYAEGHSIHDRYQTALWRLGILTGEWKCLSCEHRWWGTSPLVCSECAAPFIKYAEVPLEDPSIRLLGHADGLVETERKGQVVLEVKTVGLGTYRIEVPGVYREYQNGNMTLDQLWKSTKRPFPTHLRQVNLYLRARKLKVAVVVYEFKANQQAKEFVIRYQPELIANIVTGAQSVTSALEQDRVVKRPEWADEPDHRTCKKCVYRKTCWKIHDQDDPEAAVAVEAPVRRVWKRSR